MDLHPAISNASAQFSNATGMLLSSNIRPSVGLASSRRLLLYVLYQSTRNCVAFMVTREDEALKKITRTQPGLLVVTPHLDYGSGLDLVRKSSSVVSDICSVVICDQACDNLAAAAGSGADAVLCEQDFLTEAQPLQTIVTALSLGRKYRSPAVLQALSALRTEKDKWRDSPPPLSSREKDLLNLWIQGLGDREAAEQLGVSYSTVRGYGRTLRQKLGVSSRSQAVFRAAALGTARGGR